MTLKDSLKNVVHKATHKSDGPPSPTACDKIRSPADMILRPGDLVAVTGADDGALGTHIVEQALLQGLRVRAVLPTPPKNAWVAEHFGAAHGARRIEVVDAAHAPAKNLRGAQALVHVIGADADAAAVQKALEAAAKEPGCKRVVLVLARGVDAPAAAVGGGGEAGGGSIASGTDAAWAWVTQHRPRFVFASLSADAVFGPAVDGPGGHFGGWLGAARAVFRGEAEALPQSAHPQGFVDVRDAAAVVVGALVYADVSDERLVASAGPCCWTDVLRVYRGLCPDRTFGGDGAAAPPHGGAASDEGGASQRAEDLLRRLSGHGWTSLEDSLRDAVPGYKS
ncbi:NAD(P)-binding protein [Xylariomycetidae sp. FL0641]|nr:NAD(P)-binding protein [Xylariomycetidae sp. FL0641]